MEYLALRFGELLIGHRAIAGAEVNGSGQHLPYATAASDGLIVDFNIGMRLVIFAKPLRIDRIRERSPRSVEASRCQRGSREYRDRGEQCNASKHLRLLFQLWFYDRGVNKLLSEDENPIKCRRSSGRD